MSKPLKRHSREFLERAPWETLEKIMDNPDEYVDGTVQMACKVFEERQVDDLAKADKMNAFFDSLEGKPSLCHSTHRLSETASR